MKASVWTIEASSYYFFSFSSSSFPQRISFPLSLQARRNGVLGVRFNFSVSVSMLVFFKTWLTFVFLSWLSKTGEILRGVGRASICGAASVGALHTGEVDWNKVNKGMWIENSFVLIVPLEAEQKKNSFSAQKTWESSFLFHRWDGHQVICEKHKGHSGQH